MSGITSDLPQYRRDEDYANQEGYQELFNLILTRWFNSAGFFQPTLDNAQVTQLMAQTPPPPPGTHWLNSDLNVIMGVAYGFMQFVDSQGVVRTITST